MKKFLLILSLILICSPKCFANKLENISADEALIRLKNGNDRFIQSKMIHPDETKARRDILTKGQHPFVAILSCSDSRVPTEIIFDEGLGDIFVIRNAGNVLDEHVLGSIEYAVEHLGIKLVIVLGHESCGAVAAAMSCDKESTAIESLKKAIKPSVEFCKKHNNLTYENVIKTHAKLDVENILKDKEILNYTRNHQVKVLPAYYHLDSGKVEILN